jgi:hypothetical protein
MRNRDDIKRVLHTCPYAPNFDSKETDDAPYMGF